MDKKNDMGVKESRGLKPKKNKNKIRKNKTISINFGNLVPKIVDYLKSDSYLYSQLLSFSVPFDSSASHNGFVFSTGKSVLGKKGKVKEKLVDYLRSDTYLYAPLEGALHHDDQMVKSTISSPRGAGRELQFTRVSGSVPSRKITWQTKKVAQESINENHKDYHSSIGIDLPFESPQALGLEEVKKQAVRRSNRLSTNSG